MTFAEYQRRAIALSVRAWTITDRLTEQARVIGEIRAGTGRTYCFHLAHNWHDQADNFPAERRAAMIEILRIEQRIFRVNGIARRMDEQLWARCDANPGRHRWEPLNGAAGSLTCNTCGQFPSHVDHQLL